MLDRVIRALTHFPESFHLHPKLRGFVEQRREAIAKGAPIDWAFGEALAFGTLALEGTPVRLSGQDSGRGTFSQRHLAFYDSETGQRYVPLQHIAPDQARFDVFDSSLSEYAVLGFEFGYSVADPLTLVIWEAQFGDFANGAQIMIDQFISCAESKWGQPSGLVMLLPHGFEGQGPEHSSARIERFLTLCAENNMQVANCTTPAQYFHLLRRQMYGGHDRRGMRKPLVDLHAEEPAAPSAGRFHVARFHHRRVPRDPGRCAGAIDAGRVSRVVFCSGKIYYDLLAAREERQADHVALVRIEQFYPFAAGAGHDMLARYPADGGSGLGAGRAAQHGTVALHARTVPAAARRHPPRTPLRGPPGERQPGHRLGQAPPAGAGRNRQRRPDARRHLGNPQSAGGGAEKEVRAWPGARVSRHRAHCSVRSPGRDGPCLCCCWRLGVPLSPPWPWQLHHGDRGWYAVAPLSSVQSSQPTWCSSASRILAP